MTTYTGSPRTLRGALVSLAPVTLAPTVIVFQYNPTTLTRTFELKSASSGAGAGQIGAPPGESIKVDLVLDATDDRESGKGEEGVLPRLAALLGLVTPSSASVIANDVLSAIGTIEIVPPAAPLTLFVWGQRRVLPVVVSELSITEEAHDADLTPTLARVSVGLKVLTYADVGVFHPGHALSLAHQVAREVMAGGGTTTSLSSVLGAETRLL